MGSFLNESCNLIRTGNSMPQEHAWGIAATARSLHELDIGFVTEVNGVSLYRDIHHSTGVIQVSGNDFVVRTPNN